MKPEAIDTLDALLTVVKSGLRPRYLFFWSHRPARSNQIDRACFSQWWMAGFAIKGIRYPSTEHYMMAEKARLFGDGAMAGRILTASSPGEAKKLGRQVAGFDEETWAAACFEIVVCGNRAKFGQNPELAAFLRSTAPRILVEASPHDRVWGIGLAENDPGAKNPRLWRGRNLLGFALMQVRREL